MQRAKLVGLSHVALEVGDVDEAIEFYARTFDFVLRGRSGSMAFIDLGNQFLALMEGNGQGRPRRLGLFVDDRARARAAAAAAGATLVEGLGVAFVDPWGNRIEVVDRPKAELGDTAAVRQRRPAANTPQDAKTNLSVARRLLRLHFPYFP